MMQGRKKHILLILLLLLIAFVSMQMMAGQNYTEEKMRITVILPKDSQNELYGLLDGIRDQAYDDHVKLDVWYKSRLTEKAFDYRIHILCNLHNMHVRVIYPKIALPPWIFLDFMHPLQAGYGFHCCVRLVQIGHFKIDLKVV